MLSIGMCAWLEHTHGSPLMSGEVTAGMSQILLLVTKGPGWYLSLLLF